MFKAPRIETLKQKKLVGQQIKMSLTNDKTAALFSGFMPNKKHIKHAVSTDIFEVQIYEADHFKVFNPENTFTKWASVEVLEYKTVPESMQTLDLNGGLYAVFNYKGLAKDFSKLMMYIFTEWLPKSEYQLDDRPHFNLLGDAYKHNHPDSEEEVWIPIKEKQ